MRERQKNQKGNPSKLRKTITLEAARLMYTRTETEYFTAKRKAARRFGVDPRYQPSELPSNLEISQEILKMADLYEGEARTRKLQEMRLYALWIMEELQAFHPHLIGSTLTGRIRQGSDIDIHLFADSLAPISQLLDNCGLRYEVERKRVVKCHEERLFTHLHLHGRFEIELTLYAADLVNHRFKSSITGKAIERVSLKELKRLLSEEYPGIDLGTELSKKQGDVECYELFKLLLLPLQDIDGGAHHPEGDTLYHSLQVFELAKQWHGYDYDFLLAALLHDVGKAIDPQYHAQAGAQAVDGFVSERVTFLIRYHMDALALQKGTLGHKQKIFLRQSPNYEDLMSLRELDNEGRQRGVLVDTVAEALEYLQRLETEFS